jgi:predicted tellurium resistance membrane protein TerC
MSHICLVFSGVFITLVILNFYNPTMGFLTSTVSIVYIVLYCLAVIALSTATVADNRHHARYMRQRAEEAARWKKIGVNAQKPSDRRER